MDGRKMKQKEFDLSEKILCVEIPMIKAIDIEDVKEFIQRLKDVMKEISFQDDYKKFEIIINNLSGKDLI